MITTLADAPAFFAALEDDNTPEHWAAGRARYDAMRVAFTSLLGRFDDDWRVYRPQNSRRFHRDLPPYKTFLGAVRERADGVGVFLRLDAKGMLLGTGIPMPAPDQLAALRGAIADPTSGPALVDAIEAARSAGARVHGGRYDPLVRVPRGHPADHPRADLLRWKGVEANVRFRDPDWPALDDAEVAVRAAFERTAPVDAWLARWVGPSALTPEERFAPARRTG